MNQMLNAELGRVRRATLMREATDERLARTLRPEPEARPARPSLGRRLLAALALRAAPRPAHPLAS